MKVRIRSNSNNIEICLVRTEKGAGIVKASPRTDHATGYLSLESAAEVDRNFPDVVLYKSPFGYKTTPMFLNSCSTLPSETQYFENIAKDIESFFK